MRRITLLVLLNLLAVLVLAQVEWNAIHLGSYGMVWGVGGYVHDVQPGSPAERAGIVPGEHIDLAAMHPTDRLALLFPVAGDRADLAMISQKRIHWVSLVAAPDPPAGIRGKLLVYGYPVLVFIALCLATAVVMIRPGRPAWTFYAFAWLSTICAFQDYVHVQGPLAFELAAQAFYQVAFCGALFTLALFSTRLFHAEGAWRRRWEWTVFPLIGADLLIWTYFIFGYSLGWWNSSFNLPVAGQILDVAAASAVILVLATIVNRTSEENRQRARWAVAGLALQPLVIVLNALQGILQIAFAHWSSALVFTPLFRLMEPWAALVGALAVSYAFINEHILDIRFAIGRAGGYAITSAVLLVFMSVCEWSVGELFADSHVRAYATLVAAILAAFSFNAVHRRIDALLDFAFFRREFMAEKRLRLDARAVAFAASERSAVEFLLDEPLDALELSSAALFKLDEDRNAYVCTAMRSWPEDAMTIAIPADDPLVAQLRSEREPLSLRDIGWRHEDLPAGAQAPIVAVPALARSDLYAFAFYGAHRDGATLNPEERALLGTLVSSAAATFDHLDAQRAREEIEDLKRRLADLGGVSQ